MENKSLEALRGEVGGVAKSALKLLDRLERHRGLSTRAIYGWGQLVHKNGTTGNRLYEQYLSNMDKCDAVAAELRALLGGRSHD